jgi:hypothetical protein
VAANSVSRTSKLISKYKKQIEEPTKCTMKSDEYSMASFSVHYVNLELVRLKKELHQKSAEVDRLGMDYASAVIIMPS